MMGSYTRNRSNKLVELFQRRPQKSAKLVACVEQEKEQYQHRSGSINVTITTTHVCILT